MKVPKNISRVHFIYLSIVFVLIIGFISGFILFDNEFVVNIISVSSGIISIIIGMLAIFIAVYQGLTQGTSIQKINESADRVDDATKKLESVDFKEFGTKINSMEDILNTMSMDGKNNVKKDSNVLDFDRESFKDIFIRTDNEMFFSYFLKKTYNENEDLDFNLFVSTIIEYKESEKSNETQRMYLLVFIQFINLLSRCGGITLAKSKMSKSNRVIVMLNEEFNQAVVESEIKDNIINIIDELFN